MRFHSALHPASGEEPHVSVIVPWCGRPEIRRTLAENCASGWFRDAEILVVNCAGSAGELQRLTRDLPAARIRYIEVPAPFFNKSLALNVGIFSSRSRHIFVLDADIILQSDVVHEGSGLLDGSTFITVERVVESAPPPETRSVRRRIGGGRLTGIRRTTEISLAWSDGTETVHTTFQQEILGGERGGPGLIFLDREHLLKIGGYNSGLERWGWEDHDVQIRLMRKLALRRIELGQALHLSHGDDVRSGQARDQQINFCLACDRYSRGDLDGTYAADIADWRGASVGRTADHL